MKYEVWIRIIYILPHSAKRKMQTCTFRVVYSTKALKTYEYDRVLYARVLYAWNPAKLPVQSALSSCI